jgi:hypothetical protein
MKILIHAALLSFVVVGLLHDVPSAHSSTPVYNFNDPASPSSLETTTPIYLTGDCPAIQGHFAANPVPLGAIDAETGREIVGYEIWCDDQLVGEGGGKSPDPADQRHIPRAFGYIKVYYAPAVPPPPPPK